ncbi:hypothetical protein MACH09_46700 [Vibrio sp. MACH09]|nr:hypothetical protein MACH09_46700 [Vibrio sp. MACH09]
MSVFKKNMQRFNEINTLLGQYGLELSSDCIIDVTLPEYMHRMVCALDISSIAFEDVKSVLEVKEVAEYLNGGRENRIVKFKREQQEAEDWANRLQMTTQEMRLFAKLWKAEHKATVKINKISDKIEMAEIFERPTKRLENSLITWERKQQEAIDQIATNVESGIFPENAPEQCDHLTQNISGYIADCFHVTYQDHQPTYETDSV